MWKTSIPHVDEDCDHCLGSVCDAIRIGPDVSPRATVRLQPVDGRGSALRARWCITCWVTRAAPFSRWCCLHRQWVHHIQSVDTSCPHNNSVHPPPTSSCAPRRTGVLSPSQHSSG